MNQWMLAIWSLVPLPGKSHGQRSLIGYSSWGRKELDTTERVHFSLSSAFSKTSLNIRKFMIHVLLKPGLENFEHYFTSMWDECNCAVVWALTVPFFGIGMKTNLFQSCGHCWVFQICWHIECSTFTASSFRIWNSSTVIPSPPLAFFLVMIPKALLTSHPRNVWL